MDIVLVHGSYAGSWVWEQVAPDLESRGHSVTAVDLPISDRSAGAERYAQAVIDAAASTEPLVIVGHSMAGTVIPLVAAARPVRRLVFIAAMLPVVGKSINEQRREEHIDPSRTPATAEWTDLGDDLWSVGANTATDLFWHDAPSAVAARATARLRPQAYRVMSETTPLRAWPDVEYRYIACLDDHALDPAWQLHAPQERLGVTPTQIAGGHTPMLSRPAEIAALIHQAAT